MGVYGVQAAVWMDEKDLDKLKEVIALVDGRMLNVIMTGPRPKCRTCLYRVHLQKDCKKTLETR